MSTFLTITNFLRTAVLTVETRIVIVLVIIILNPTGG